MEKLIHSGDAYIRFDAMVRRVEDWLQSRCRSEFGYPGEALAARLAQAFVEHNLNPYMSECGNRGLRGEYPLPEDDRDLVFGGMTTSQQDGSVKISPALLLKSLGIFFLHWAHVLVHVLPLAARVSGQPLSSATLLYGVGRESLFDHEQGSDFRFADYCRSCEITPLRDAGRLIVQAVDKSGPEMKATHIYCRHPVHSLLRGTFLGFAGRSRLLVGHVGVIFVFAAAVLRNPLLTLLARDVAYLPMIRALDEHGKIDALLLTNSAYPVQPLWMRDPESRRFRVHMIWYSQNIFPFVFKGDSAESQYPSYRHMRVDEHWVWTQSFADYLTEIGVTGDKRVVGPILWYLPENVETAIDADPDSIKLAVLDVAPVSEERSNNVGFLNNYYNPDTAIKFIEDIAAMAGELGRLEDRPVEILFKCKRGYNPGHHSAYVARVNELADAGSISMISYQTNLYSLIGQSDVSIVLPNSSPALVSAHLNKKAIYYDPTDSLIANHELDPDILGASNPAALLEAVRSIVGGDR